MFETALLFFAAVLPGLYAWWSGRGLTRDLDDPLLNERAFARGRRVTLVTIVAVVVVAVVGGAWATAILPLLIVGVMLGTYPSRRALLEEDWGPVAYLSHQARLLLGMFGPWILLLAGPLVYMAWPDAALPTSPAYVGGLALWGIFGGPVLIRLLRVRPLADQELLRACEPVLAAASCRAPELLVTEADGSRWANAFAVPRPGAPAVLFTDGLLRDLDRDEIRAILGHELAHLEDFDGGRWLPRALAPAALGLGLVVALQLGKVVSPWVAWLFPVALLLVLVFLGGRVQKRETASDRRAIELAGDPDALARGLEKIHARARMPRRMDSELEARLSHPSLARRLRDIRAVGAEAAEATGATEALTPGDRSVPASRPPLHLRAISPLGAVIVLADDRFHSFENVPSESGETLDALQSGASGRSYPYGTLRELRVEARGRKRFLVLRDAVGGRPQRFRIEPSRVPQLQDRLDGIDLQLAGGSGARVADRNWRLARLSALVAALVAALAGAFGFLLAALATALMPRRPILWAAGVTGAVAAAATMLGGRPTLLPVGPSPLLGPLVGAVAVLLLVLAERSRGAGPERTDTEDLTVLVVAGLGLTALVLLVFQLSAVPAGSLLMGAHLWARDLPEPLALLTGAGAGLLLLERRPARVAGTLALIAAGLVAATGLNLVRARSGDLLAEAPPVQSVPPLEGELLRTVTVDKTASIVRIDPAGGAILVGAYPEDGSVAMEYRVEYRVDSDGRAGTWREVRADQLEWSDGGRLVGLVLEEGVVFVEDPDGGNRAEYALGRLQQADLRTGGGDWMVTDHGDEGPSLTVYAGPVSRAATDHRTEVRPRTVALPPGRALASVALTERALVFSTSMPERGWLPSVAIGAWPMSYAVAVAPDGADAAVLLDGASAMGLDCRAGTAGEAICVTHATTRTEVWTVDPSTAHIRPIAALRGWWWGEPATDGVILDDYRSAPAWVGGDPAGIWRLPVDGYQATGVTPGTGWRQALDVAGDLMAVAWADGERSRVDIYRLRTPPAGDRSGD